MAIQLLGEYRATEASDLLVELVSIEIPNMDFWNDNHLAQFPSIYALISIGTPSIQSIFRRLSRPASEKEIRMYAYIINAIDGYDTGVYRIQSTFNNPELPKIAKENFLLLLNFFKQKQSDIDLWISLNPNRKELNKALQEFERNAQIEEAKAAAQIPAPK